MTEFEEENEFSEEKISPYAAQRRLEKNRMERKVRQSKMWLRRLQIFTRMTTIILLILLGYKLIKLPQWYLDKNVFNSLNNPSLEILNNKIVPSYKVLAALRKTELPHIPIYRLETDEIKHNILQLEPVKDVYIRRFWFPARLQIIIEERIPVITISPEANVPPIAFFAKGGKLIGRDYMPLSKSFKTILVLSYGTKGSDYRNWDNEKVKILEKIAKSVEVNSNEKVEYIDYRNPKDVYVKVKTANIRLGELDDDVFNRINRISSILPQVKTLDKKIKYIDLRWKDANYIKLE
ncbi:MAG: FtsQ-type POTRA domain-containing protein [Candidatus Gastranaerophilales bacterium]|nr:FtsQ-type POTRA domain-containing protein [Candidatus Gastranaerophilales bacterium]